jgi:ATP-dependent helicase YprA (DUF1998 family)
MEETAAVTCVSPPPLLAVRLAALTNMHTFMPQYYLFLPQQYQLSLSLCVWATGKSLIYHIPVIEEVLASPDFSATAMYIFPTKALAQDQLQSLSKLCDAVVAAMPAAPSPYPFRVFAVDGDMDHGSRQHAAETCNIMLTNPDMLHCSLLPDHKRWKHFFEQLKFVVIDECHMYKGVFGAHVAGVLKRLQRVVVQHRMGPGRDRGEGPRFICLSATIANPLEHVLRLLPVSSGRRDSQVVGEGDGEEEEAPVMCIPAEADGSPVVQR